jgi:hypothetical protein
MKTLANLIVIKRFTPSGRAQKKASFLRIPQPKRKLADDAIRGSFAPLLEGQYDQLRICTFFDSASAIGKYGAKVFSVVDATIQDELEVFER